MPSEFDEEGVDSARGTDDRRGPEEDLFQRLTVEERRKDDDEALPAFAAPAVRADRPHGIEDLVARDSREQISRVLERPDRNRVPRVEPIDPTSQGRADPAVPIIEKPSRLDPRQRDRKGRFAALRSS